MLGQYEDEIADMNKVLQLKPQYAEAYFLRGIANLALNQYESAIADIDESTQLNLDDSIVYISNIFRGLANVGLGSYESAIADFDNDGTSDFKPISYIFSLLSPRVFKI